MEGGGRRWEEGRKGEKREGKEVGKEGREGKREERGRKGSKNGGEEGKGEDESYKYAKEQNPVMTRARVRTRTTDYHDTHARRKRDSVMTSQTVVQARTYFLFSLV